MDNWFFEYELKIWNDVSNEEEIAYGIVYGKNFKETVDKIEKYYGEDNIIALSLSPTIENKCYDFTRNFKEEPSGFFKDIILVDKNLLK